VKVWRNVLIVYKYINYFAYLEYINRFNEGLVMKKLSRAQGHAKEQTTKGEVVEVRVKFATKETSKDKAPYDDSCMF